ncbi:hypothetical protein [Cyanobium sp. LEGE 06113]|uniref:hypothetical protein n=1 Tax=Cyanobium sp. LEGE 06113 TaxID=1297573 RepID=UPI001880D374|nr:hypothetical protein [Cyanobium sp. LEGE 06113]MBE9154217.1 hypothetical protein [Cyanobium sp. LEGE 06113]
MTKLSPAFLALPLALALSACGSEPEPAANSADSFAARINQNGTATPAAQGTVAPTVAEPKPGAAPGVFVPGTQTDPASATCGANLMGPFIGQPADESTRAAIVAALGRSDNLRFVAFGSGGYVNPDPTNPRLSLMLDEQNIIRDARCG